jgi:hypothetical protein
MKKLEEINGQQVAIDGILRPRQQSSKEIIFILGLPGAGTTWVLEKCTQLWEQQGNVALSAKGEMFAADRRLFPWLTMVLPGTKRLARLEVLKQGVAQGSRAIPIVGSGVTYLVDEVLNHEKHRLARQALFLTDQEQDLLYIIQATAANKRLLLTLDRPELWDDASWSLLALILSNKLDDLYPAVRAAIIVVGAPDAVPPRLQKLVSNSKVSEFRIRALELSEMPVALLTFDFPPLSQPDVERLYQVTNGRLDLLRDVSHHFHNHNLPTSSTNWDCFYSTLVKRRLLCLSADVNDVQSILSAAAVIGRTFTIKDVACLTGSAVDAVLATFRLATREHLLNAVGELAQFESAELHKYFHREGASEHTKYHSKFAECLRMMRPGDYGHRLRHLQLAGQTEDALTCFALSALSARREYRPSPDPGDLVKESAWPETRRYLDQMFAAFDAYDDQRVTEGSEILEGIEPFLPQVLIAERDYLEALLLLITPSIANYARARSVLEKWMALSATEGEVWARIAQTLFVALAETGSLDEARQLEASLTAAYWERRNVDPWALHGLNLLRRRAECLHSLPTATQRLESALEYFGGAKEHGVPRNPIQYYYTLTNVIGNKIARGQFSEANSKAVELEELIHRLNTLTWPMPEVAANNSILARYLAGTFDAKAGAELLAKVFSESAEAGDRLLLQNNYAVLLILSNQPAEALALLNRAYAAILSGEEPDGYHRYFLGNNIAALSTLRGDVHAALKTMAECGAVLDQFYPAIHATMARRHELLLEAMKKASQLTPKAFDNILFERYPQQIGPQWTFYGRGFLLTDIQFWLGD